MEKYLITGFSGFVAGHFVNLLESLKTNCEILGVDVNDPAELPQLEYVTCNFQQLNLLDKEAVSDVIDRFRPDYILHLASFSSVAFSWKYPVEAFVNNSNIFLNVVDAVRLLKLKCRILSVGSSEEYGRIDPDVLPLTETVPTRPSSPYAVARVSQEMLSEIYAHSYGVDLVLTRSFNHIGPGQKDIFVISSFASQLSEIKHSGNEDAEILVGNIDVIRDFVDVRDVVSAYHLLFKKGLKGEIYNVCSGHGISLREILADMIKLLDISVTIKTDNNLIRPGENEIVIGSPDKLVVQTGWQRKIELVDSLKDIINYWMIKTGEYS